ncbi:hypothetical protein ACVBEQ_17180 [Nakamurella sp. GG22]
MRSSQGAIDRLSVLSDALDGPLENLPVVFRAVAVDLAGAMPVLLGMTVMVHVDGTPVVLSSVIPDNAVPVRASLLLSLLPLGVATTTGSVGFYSGTPGAFLTLADGVCWIFNLDGRPALDEHLPAVPENNTVPSCPKATHTWWRRRPNPPVPG